MKDNLALRMAIIIAAAVLLGFIAAVSTVGFPASIEQPAGEIGSGLR